MTQITAVEVKQLRGLTGLPMMECKKALQETKGDQQAAIEWLRKQGIKTKETRLGRETSTGRIAVYASVGEGVGAMIELQCESAPVAGSPEFRAFAHDLAKQLATGSGAVSAEELLAQPSLSKPGMTMGEQQDDMFNRIREVFRLSRIVRIDNPCGGYAHHDGTLGALVEVSGGTDEAAKDVAMHVVASTAQVVSKDDLDPAAVEKEREILTQATLREGKPDNIVAKIVEGRLRNFFAERVLLQQPFVKDDSQTVEQFAKQADMKVISFVKWQLGKDGG